MTPLVKGLAIAVVHVALVAVVGGVLLYERATLPRAWALTTGVDPVLPIRGRYVSLRLVVEPRGELPAEALPEHGQIAAATLAVENGRLIATVLPQSEEAFSPGGKAQILQRVKTPTGTLWTLLEPVAFFLPEDAPDPTRLEPGQELWALVTVPAAGPPRPLRLEVR